METLINEIVNLQAAMRAEMQKALDGNKAAAKRARKSSLELDSLHKKFRKISV